MVDCVRESTDMLETKMGKWTKKATLTGRERSAKLGVMIDLTEWLSMMKGF